MTRRDWWLGVSAIVLAMILHAAVPRYEWRHQVGREWLRVDRWSGNAELVYANAQLGMRFPLR